MSFHLSIHQFSYPKSEDLPVGLKHSALRCYRRLPTGIIPGLKLGELEERERIRGESTAWRSAVKEVELHNVSG